MGLRPQQIWHYISEQLLAKMQRRVMIRLCYILPKYPKVNNLLLIKYKCSCRNDTRDDGKHVTHLLL